MKYRVVLSDEDYDTCVEVKFFDDINELTYYILKEVRPGFTVTIASAEEHNSNYLRN